MCETKKNCACGCELKKQKLQEAKRILKEEVNKPKKKIVIYANDLDNELQALVTSIMQMGNAGHSFEIVVDPKQNVFKHNPKHHNNGHVFFWDGDGLDKIFDVEVEDLEVKKKDDTDEANGPNVNEAELPELPEPTSITTGPEVTTLGGPQAERDIKGNVLPRRRKDDNGNLADGEADYRGKDLHEEEVIEEDININVMGHPIRRSFKLFISDVVKHLTPLVGTESKARKIVSLVQPTVIMAKYKELEKQELFNQEYNNIVELVAQSLQQKTLQTQNAHKGIVTEASKVKLRVNSNTKRELIKKAKIALDAIYSIYDTAERQGIKDSKFVKILDQGFEDVNDLLTILVLQESNDDK